MKRYKLFSCQCGCGEVDYAESTSGEWVKYEDVEWLFNEKFQINKLELNEGDILITRPSDGIWSPAKAAKIHELIKELLEKLNYHVSNITFCEEVNLGIISTDKSN